MDVNRFRENWRKHEFTKEYFRNIISEILSRKLFFQKYFFFWNQKSFCACLWLQFNFFYNFQKTDFQSNICMIFNLNHQYCSSLNHFSCKHSFKNIYIFSQSGGIRCKMEKNRKICYWYLLLQIVTIVVNILMSNRNYRSKQCPWLQRRVK